MPALREHKEDIPALAESLLSDMNTKHRRQVSGLSDEVLQMFTAYNWPGNVREMRNTLERAVIVCQGPVVEKKHLPPNFGTAMPTAAAAADDPGTVRLGVGTTVEEAERQLIMKTLDATHNNKTRAAEILGISLKTLHNKLKEYAGQVAAGRGEG